ncbi:MAG: isoprenyl transferase [Candidatus Omnitrophica bacterium]|nr:isoprenyl transferase [Candidatus Omnitrophota bacterium]
MNIDRNKVPTHVAIIMDGNGRWAKARRLPKIMGHREGIKTVERIISACKGIGVKILTLYVFSTENWKRPGKEISGLMNLLENYLSKFASKLKKEGVRLNAIGDISGLPLPVQKRLKSAINFTRDNTSFTLNLAINYGSRREILEAAKSICRLSQSGSFDIEKLKEDDFSQYLYTKGMPDPDLLIRTSGEMRLSNFLLWQLSYTEIYVTEKLWPDFRKTDFIKAVEAYQTRKRRYGSS